MGLFRDVRTLASVWASAKKRQLQHRGVPDTRVDDPINNRRSATFDGQEIDRDTLTDIRDMRESGGVISQLVRSKALMQFGTGVEWQAENEAVKEWLEDTFGNLDNLLIDLGEDAIWYPYSVAKLVETRGGGFSYVEPIEPWTMLPTENEYGEIVRWTQTVQQGFETKEKAYPPEEIAHFVLSKASARDNTGISEVKRAEAEIEAYRNHSQAVTNGIMLHGYPQRHVAVGREGGAMMDDNDLRRVRNQFDEWDTDTVWVTGADVDISEIEAQNFEFDKVTEHDLRKLALALGLPLELANVGSDGLGSGMPAELRKQLFERQARAAQRALADQFVTQVARPVLEEYSPFPADDVDVSLTFGDPVNSMESRKAKIDAIGEDMTVNERRREFDMSKVEDEEIGEEYESPGGSDDGGMLPDDGGGGGFFSDGRSLQEVPDNAQPIDDPGECDGSVIEGPQGGTYCVPAGEGGGEDAPGERPDAAADAEEVESEVRDIVEGEGDPTDELRSHISEKTGVDDVTLQPLDSEEDTVQMASTLAYAGEQGLTDEVEEITFATGEEFGLYNFNDNRLEFNPNVSVEEDLAGSVEEGVSVGEDMEWLVMHELGHANHHGELGDDMDEVGAVFDSGIAVSRDGEWVGRERIDMVDEQVSSYARSNPGEFVAEVFAGLALGQEFDDDVMEIYEEWDGPDTWQNYRGEN